MALFLSILLLLAATLGLCRYNFVRSYCALVYACTFAPTLATSLAHVLAYVLAPLLALALATALACG